MTELMVTVPGFVDRHTHLLRMSAGALPGWMRGPVGDYHRALGAAGSSPMDEPAEARLPDMAEGLLAGLNQAASLGLVEVWEAGMAEWGFLDALLELDERGALPVRVKLLATSGLAERSAMRVTGTSGMVQVVGVKFYADGWLGPRTCCLTHDFADGAPTGVLFQDGPTMARRMTGLADAGWMLATHAIGDAAIDAVLDAYENVFAGPAPTGKARIEHVQVLRADQADRMAAMNVSACIQPGFKTSDACHARAALGDAYPNAYDWRCLLDAGVHVVAGSDYPIESLDPLVAVRQLCAAGLTLDEALALTTDEDAGVSILTSGADVLRADDLAIVGTRPAA